MPDLALKTEAVLKEVEAVFDFWLEKGVDGFRLDAAKEYFTGEAQKNIELLGRFKACKKSGSRWISRGGGLGGTVGAAGVL